MNLGIEDAYMAAELLADGRTADYSAKRLPYLRRTVAMINRMTTMMTSTAALPRFMRARTGLARVVLPIAMPYARRFALGLN